MLTTSTLLLLLHAHHALLSSPTPNRQLDEARLTWGQSNAVHGAGEVRRLGSKRRREELAKELSGLLVWVRLWRTLLRKLTSRVPTWLYALGQMPRSLGLFRFMDRSKHCGFFGFSSTATWCVARANSATDRQATWFPYRYALRPAFQRNEAAIDTGVYWTHGLLVYFGRLVACAAIALTPQFLLRFYDRCKQIYERSRSRKTRKVQPLEDEAPSPTVRTNARTPRPTPRLPGALSLTPTPKPDTPTEQRNASAMSTPSRRSRMAAKESPADSPTLAVQAQKSTRRERPETPITRAESLSESPRSDEKRRRGNTPDAPSKRERSSDGIDTPSKRVRKQQAPLDVKPRPQVTRVGNVSARASGIDPSEQADRRSTRAPQNASRKEPRRAPPPSQLPRAKRVNSRTTAERSKARRVEQDARPGQADAPSASQGRMSTANGRTAGRRLTSGELGAAPRTRSQSRRTVD